MNKVDEYGVEYSEDGKTLIRCPKDFEGEYIIPNGVTSIKGKAFEGCTQLISINIPNSVTRIGHSAFTHCIRLTSITIPDSVTSIGSGAFVGCRNLSSVKISANVKIISDYTFGLCSSLTTVKIPDGVTQIEWSAFTGCNHLTSISIPNSMRIISSRAFSGCDSLTSITIPDTVEMDGVGSFDYCPATITVTKHTIFEGVKEDVDKGEVIETIKASSHKIVGLFETLDTLAGKGYIRILKDFSYKEVLQMLKEIDIDLSNKRGFDDSNWSKYSKQAKYDNIFRY